MTQTMTLETITPEVARDWLARSGENFRRLDKARAARLADNIRHLGWTVDANPLKFDSKGRLVDGQHRLAALVELGIAVQTWVARGVDDDKTIDVGRPRTIVDYLLHRGEKNVVHLASALHYIWKHERGHSFLYNGARSTPSPRELLDLLERRPEIRACVVSARRCRDVVSVGQMAYLRYVVGGWAESFIDVVASGANLAEDDPVLRLRERMLANRVTKAKLPGPERLALLIKAWNAWHEGRRMKCLKWHAVGRAAEEFPQIVVPAGDENAAA